MPGQGLKELYIDELKDLYNAENQLIKALPKMAKAASSDELRQGFEEHLEQTKGHVQRLEKIFQTLGDSPKGKTCKGMEGLIKEGSEVMEEDFEDSLMDAALIGAAQRVEHYEIAAYGTVSAFAEELGETDQASLLNKTLEEEKETDEKLTTLAEQINAQANEAGDQEEKSKEAVKQDNKKPEEGGVISHTGSALAHSWVKALSVLWSQRSEMLTQEGGEYPLIVAHIQCLRY